MTISDILYIDSFNTNCESDYYDDEVAREEAYDAEDRKYDESRCERD